MHQLYPVLKAGEAKINSELFSYIHTHSNIHPKNNPHRASAHIRSAQLVTEYLLTLYVLLLVYQWQKHYLLAMLRVFRMLVNI